MLGVSNTCKLNADNWMTNLIYEKNLKHARCGYAMYILLFLDTKLSGMHLVS